METLLDLFTKEQFAKEIQSNLTNSEISVFIEKGLRLLNDAELCLKLELFHQEIGKTKKQIELDIARIRYNLEEFVKALLFIEKADVITNYGNAMYFHMN